MKRFPLISSVLTVAALLFCHSPLAAQQKRISPHETISTVVDGNRIILVYGRPYTKDPNTGERRKIWGGLVPYGEVWRTGADEATLLITEKPLVFGGATIPAGAYTLWTLPNQDGTAKLMINKQIGQWGIKGHGGGAAHDEHLDVVSLDLKKETLDHPIDQFTMAIDKAGILKMKWETTQLSTPFSVVK